MPDKYFKEKGQRRGYIQRPFSGFLNVDDKKKKSRDFIPAWEGADIDKRDWDKMTPKQKKEYTDKYGD